MLEQIFIKAINLLMIIFVVINLARAHFFIVIIKIKIIEK